MKPSSVAANTSECDSLRLRLWLWGVTSKDWQGVMQNSGALVRDMAIFSTTGADLARLENLGGGAGSAWTSLLTLDKIVCL